MSSLSVFLLCILAILIDCLLVYILGHFFVNHIGIVIFVICVCRQSTPIGLPFVQHLLLEEIVQILKLIVNINLLSFFLDKNNYVSVTIIAQIMQSVQLMSSDEQGWIWCGPARKNTIYPSENRDTPCTTSNKPS